METQQDSASDDSGRNELDDTPDATSSGESERPDTDDSLESDDEIEYEEILLPETMRDSLDELAHAIRNVIRTQPLVVVAVAAGAAYVAGRIAAKK